MRLTVGLPRISAFREPAPSLQGAPRRPTEDGQWAHVFSAEMPAGGQPLRQQPFPRPRKCNMGKAFANCCVKRTGVETSHSRIRPWKQQRDDSSKEYGLVFDGFYPGTGLISRAVPSNFG